MIKPDLWTFNIVKWIIQYEDLKISEIRYSVHTRFLCIVVKMSVLLTHITITVVRDKGDYPSQYMPLVGKPGISTNIDMYI